MHAMDAVADGRWNNGPGRKAEEQPRIKPDDRIYRACFLAQYQGRLQEPVDAALLDEGAISYRPIGNRCTKGCHKR
jgi:hypothetical protein